MAGAAAVTADFGARLDQAGAQALTRQFQQAEGTDASDLDAGPVMPHSVLETPLHRSVVAVLLHVDEIDDDEPGEITQPQLTRNLIGGFQIGAQRGFLDVALARRPSRIDVDRDQRLGRVDDDVAARSQIHDRVVYGIELAFDLEAMEEMAAVIPVE